MRHGRLAPTHLEGCHLKPKKKTRVLLLTRYSRLGASSRVRHHDVARDLEKRDFEFDTHALLDDAYLQARYSAAAPARLLIVANYLSRLRQAIDRDRHDVVWVEKEAFPWLPWAAERLFYRRGSSPIVLDFDDYWPGRYHAVTFFKDMGERKFKRAIRAAAAVTAANEHLAELLRLSCDRVIDVVHNGIDVDRYAIAAAKARALRRNGAAAPLRVGWIGTPYTAGLYLDAITPLLNRLTEEGVIEVTLIGANGATPTLLANRRPWSEATEADEIAGLDVGLMPIGNGAFEAGKSGWKLLQFMAAGRTVIGSSIGFNCDLITHGRNGFLAGAISDFEGLLRLLATDRDLVEKMGCEAAATAATRFARADMVDRVARVLERAAGIRRRMN